ncbi:hypothetical protein D3C87_2126390 [compost metagenome]
MLTRSLHGAQAVSDDLVGDGLEPVEAPVDVWRLETDTEVFDRVLVQHLELVGVVHFHGHVGAEELRGEMHLEPARVIRQQ